MVKNIIFDIGNVLVPFNWYETLLNLYDSETAEKIADATVRQTELWHELDKGSMSEAKIIEQFKLLCLEYSDKIEEALTEIYKNLKPYPYTDEWIYYLKKAGYNVYILSNYGRTPFMISKANFEFLKHVDGSVISYEVERIKPDPFIYMILMQKYSLEPSESVFIDDKPQNVEAAKELGIYGITHTSPDETLKGLQVLGVYF